MPSVIGPMRPSRPNGIGAARSNPALAMTTVCSTDLTRGWSHRQERAKIVRESQKASDEVRAARSALLGRKDLERQQQEALVRVEEAGRRAEAFDPESHATALAEAVREAEELATALAAPSIASPSKKVK